MTSVDHIMGVVRRLFDDRDDSRAHEGIVGLTWETAESRTQHIRVHLAHDWVEILSPVAKTSEVSPSEVFSRATIFGLVEWGPFYMLHHRVATRQLGGDTIIDHLRLIANVADELEEELSADTDAL